MTYKGLNGTNYTLIEPALANGGEGTVYEIANNPNSVLKVFHAKCRTDVRQRKLLAMVKSPIDKNALSQVTWPTDVVYDNGQFIGYVMPKIEKNEDLNVMYSDKYSFPLYDKITMGMNLCAAINAVHNAGQVCGDLNPRNISVNPAKAIVTLVDTDSYHITDHSASKIYRCIVGLPEYLPREVQEKMSNGYDLLSAPLPTFTKNTDNFALAVHIFALLMNGCHPFACAKDSRTAPINNLSVSRNSITVPQPIDNILNGYFPFQSNRQGLTTPLYAPEFNTLPKAIQDLFIKAFVDGHSDPSKRPGPVEWYNALKDYRGNLKTCSVNKSHMYLKSLNSCPLCEVNKRMLTGMKPFAQVPSSTQLVQNSISTTPYANGGSTYSGQSTNNYPVQGQIGNRINNATGYYPGSQITAKKSSFLGKIVKIIIAFVLISKLLDACAGSSNKNRNYADNSATVSSVSTESVAKNSGAANAATDAYLGSSGSINSISGDSDSDYMESSDGYTSEIIINDIRIDSLPVNSVSYPSADINSNTGNIWYENQEDLYYFQASYDGVYRIDITGILNDTAVALYLYDGAGNKVESNTYCKNNQGITAKDLLTGQIYTVKIRQERGYTPYNIAIGMQKAPQDITGVTEFTDSIGYEDQKNAYYFTAPKDGYYRFDFSEVHSDTAFDVRLYDSLGYKVASNSYCKNEGGFTAENLVAGEIYELQVRQSSEYGSYKVNIGYQKETVDISGYNVVEDSIEYEDQRNVYIFKAPKDGDYEIMMTEILDGTAVNVAVYDYLDAKIGFDSYCKNGNEFTVNNLKAGDTYTIIVKYGNGCSGYTLSIMNAE